MRVLVVGDVVGRPGRQALARGLPELRSRYAPDAIVVNADNAAGGRGLTPAVAEELFALGIDVLTGGDHIWDRREILPLLDREPRLLRPANLPPGNPGRGVAIVECAGGRLGVVHLQGRVFLDLADDPFAAADALLAELAGRVDAVIVDFHAEATSEKEALAHYLDGRVAAVLGTHAHVQTADARLLPGGTAAMTDLGRTGPTGGVLGLDPEAAIRWLRRLHGGPRAEPAAGPVEIQGALVVIDPRTGRACALEPVRWSDERSVA